MSALIRIKFPNLRTSDGEVVSVKARPEWLPKVMKTGEAAASAARNLRKMFPGRRS